MARYRVEKKRTRSKPPLDATSCHHESLGKNREDNEEDKEEDEEEEEEIPKQLPTNKTFSCLLVTGAAHVRQTRGKTDRYDLS